MQVVPPLVKLAIWELFIGASYAFAPNLAIVAEYTNFGKVAKNDVDTRDSLKVAQVSAGVRFSF